MAAISWIAAKIVKITAKTIRPVSSFGFRMKLNIIIIKNQGIGSHHLNTIFNVLFKIKVKDP